MRLSRTQFTTFTIAFFFISAVAFFASCNRNAVNPISKNPGKSLSLTTVEQEQVSANNSFTLKLFRNLDSADISGNNLFVSPLSVSFALGMTSNGANGQTLDAFKKVLNFNGLTQSEVNSYYNNLITNLPQLDPNTTLNIANSIWYKNTFNVLPQFLTTDSTYFHAQIASLDFTNPSSVNTINNWVNTQTNGKINKIINSINSQDVMFLINAIYFKSTWKEKFDPGKTTLLPFNLSNGSQVQAKFMDGTIDFNRFDNNEVNVFELPYSNSKFSMLIAMPASGTSVHQLIAGLDSAKWASWMQGLHTTNSELKLPKFTFSYGISLNDALMSLGLGIAFSDGADFSGINANIPLQISAVNHKAFVAVDESGTTAAGVTSITITPTDVLLNSPTVIDHPFVFAIREMSTGVILFTGTVNNPLLTGN